MTDREPRPTDGEITELHLMCQAANSGTDYDVRRLGYAAREWLPRLLDLVTKEGGDPHTPPGRPGTPDKSPPARSSDAPARAMKTGESVGGMDVPSAQLTASLSVSGTSPGLSLPKGMETTVLREQAAYELSCKRFGLHEIMVRAADDLDRALAEVARLQEALRLKYGSNDAVAERGPRHE